MPDGALFCIVNAAVFGMVQALQVGHIDRCGPSSLHPTLRL